MSGYVTIKCRHLKGTDNAYRIADLDGEIHWIPASQVKSCVRDPHTGDGTITLSQWIAEKKGLVS
jgi:hypothetical protein